MLRKEKTYKVCGQSQGEVDIGVVSNNHFYNATHELLTNNQYKYFLNATF